jgi:oligopeptidase B
MLRSQPFVASSALAFLLPFLPAQDAPKAPTSKQVPHTETWHGRTFSDPWFWLRDKQNPEVRAWLEAENAFTKAVTKDLQPMQDKLYAEFTARVKQTDLSVPVRDGRFHYYSRTVEGQQYPIQCRRLAAADGRYDEAATEQVVLDQNAMAKGLAYLGIGDTAYSDDGNLLAYTTDTTGFRQYTLHVKDLRTGEERRDLAQRVTAVEWSADGKTLVFATEHEVTKRSDQVWRLELGKAPELLREEKDELFRIGVSRTRDKKYLLCGAGSTDTAEWWYLDASTPTGEWRTLLGRKKGHRYRADHRDGSFYVVSNDQGPNFRVVQVPVGASSLAAGKEVVPHKDDVLVSGFDVFAGHAVVQERTQALPRFRVLDFAASTWREITFPEPVYAAFAGGTPEFTSTTYRIAYQSLVTPSCVYDYDLKSPARERKKQTEVAGYDPTRYRTERLWAKARDGVQVPISIVYRVDRARDGGPLWLYAYGSYGMAMPPTFDSNRISLLDRGVAFAIAHIRGGNELGENWHRDGMLMKKKNTFFDFIDCAEFLVGDKWTSPARLVIEGGSAGGLLMGAVANLRPDLFRAVHSAVPFVDVMNTMMDASLPLTVGEYLEWGNPNEKAAFDYMLSYSPYDNLDKKAYPATLVTTSFNDSQVMYWEPAKYVAKLRTLLQGDQRGLLLQCKLEAAGHGGASGRYDRWRDQAFEMAWMLAQVGITQ